MVDPKLLEQWNKEVWERWHLNINVLWDITYIMFLGPQSQYYVGEVATNAYVRIYKGKIFNDLVNLQYFNHTIKEYLTSDPTPVYIRAQNKTTSVSVMCECGADTIRTTHSNWCPKYD